MLRLMQRQRCGAMGTILQQLQQAIHPCRPRTTGQRQMHGLNLKQTCTCGLFEYRNPVLSRTNHLCSQLFITNCRVKGAHACLLQDAQTLQMWGAYCLPLCTTRLMKGGNATFLYNRIFTITTPSANPLCIPILADQHLVLWDCCGC